MGAIETMEMLQLYKWQSLDCDQHGVWERMKDVIIGKEEFKKIRSIY